MNEGVQSSEERRRSMDFVMAAGQTLLENGGEVFRVQQTMYIMARALHLREFNVYVLSNGIFASAGTAEISEVRHVPECGMHLGRVAALNELSRQLAAGKIESLLECEQRLVEIRALPPSPPWAQVVASGAGAAFFSMLFGGSFADGFAAALAGLCVALLLQATGKLRLSGLFAKLCGSALATVCCLILAGCFPAVNRSNAIIGALMVLTPGVAFTTGVRDLVHSDYLSGAIRLADAMLSAGAIAGGVALVYGAVHLAGGVL